MTVEARLKLEKLVRYFRYELKFDGSEDFVKMSLSRIARLTGLTVY